MKRVTILFDDERLYRELKAAAAMQGRPVKDVVAEAVGEWLTRRASLSPEQKQQLQEALRMADELRERQRLRGMVMEPSIEDTLDELRRERS